MNDSILYAAIAVAILTMLLAMIDTMLRRRAAERHIMALTDRLIKQRRRIAFLQDRLIAMSKRWHERDADTVADQIKCNRQSQDSGSTDGSA